MSEIDNLLSALNLEKSSIQRRLMTAEATKAQAAKRNVQDADTLKRRSFPKSRKIISEEPVKPMEKLSKEEELARTRITNHMDSLANRLRERFGTIRAAFLHLDTDRSSVLDAGEFKTILKLYNFDNAAAEEMVKELDRNGDSLIEFLC